MTTQAPRKADSSRWLKPNARKIDLVQKCLELGIARKGTNAELKKRITDHITHDLDLTLALVDAHETIAIKVEKDVVELQPIKIEPECDLEICDEVGRDKNLMYDEFHEHVVSPIDFADVCEPMQVPPVSVVQLEDDLSPDIKTLKLNL